MTSEQEAKLNRIIKLLERSCDIIDPNPSYRQNADGLWRNRQTGELQLYEYQRRFSNAP